MRLGIDSFSLRWQGWDPFQVLDFAHAHRLTTVHFSERAHLGTLDEQHLRRIKSHAVDLGIQIEVGMRSIDRFATTFDPAFGSGEQQLFEMLHVAKALDSSVLRCFMGMYEDRVGPVPLTDHVAESTRVLRLFAPEAERLGVTIAVENHGGVDLLARELLTMVMIIDSPRIGVCLDLGNPVYACEDPLLAAEILAPYVATVHLRDSRIWSTPAGCAVQWVPTGQGDLDLPRIIDTLKGHRNPAVNLEIITGRAPRLINYLEPSSSFWDAYPDVTARDFSRFLALQRDAHPRPLDQLELAPELSMPDAALLPAFRAQQLRHVEESIAWCTNHLSARL